MGQGLGKTDAYLAHELLQARPEPTSADTTTWQADEYLNSTRGR